MQCKKNSYNELHHAHWHAHQAGDTHTTLRGRSIATYIAGGGSGSSTSPMASSAMTAAASFDPSPRLLSVLFSLCLRSWRANLSSSRSRVAYMSSLSEVTRITCLSLHSAVTSAM